MPSTAATSARVILTGLYDVMAGQSVGMVKKEEPVADILAELVDETTAALGSRG